ncbi:hypothetical protein BH10BAC2_BH10BAC2_28980 [soil metagenome]
MKSIFTLLFFFLSVSAFSQAEDTAINPSCKTGGIVTFITKLDIANATKDGIYLNGYVVNIGYARAKELDGKKIKMTGKITIVKGIKNLPNKEIQQGREVDTKYIKSPKIEIIRD